MFTFNLQERDQSPLVPGADSTGDGHHDRGLLVELRRGLSFFGMQGVLGKGCWLNLVLAVARTAAPEVFEEPGVDIGLADGAKPTLIT